MQLDAVDGITARSYADDWIQTNLVDSHLVVFGAHLQLKLGQPDLLNRSEVSVLPVVGHGRSVSTVTVSPSLAIAHLEKSVQFTRSVEMHRERETIQRSLRWFRKAKATKDVVDGFVMQWIAFNALYGLFTPDKKGDQAAIRGLINAHPSHEKIKEILKANAEAIDELATSNLTDWRGQRNYSDELKRLIGNTDVRRTLMAVSLCLFSVRNQVFHGGTTPVQELDFVRKCCQLLEFIYRKCLCSYVGLT
jgi:hypothetical protein